LNTCQGYLGKKVLCRFGIVVLHLLIWVNPLCAQPSRDLVSKQVNFSQPDKIAEHYPVANQSDRFPLWTRFSPGEVRAFNKIFTWGETFDKAKVLELRETLKEAAQQGDVVGQLYLARTYDLYPYGMGDPNDAQISMNGYLRAAQQNYAEAEYFLYEVFRYSLMQIPKNEQTAFSWIIRARKHASKQFTSDIALEFARFYDPQLGDEYHIADIEPNQTQSSAYREEAFKLDPSSQSAIDSWGITLLDQKRYAEAVAVLSKSQNSNYWGKLGFIYENGLGVPQNYSEAARWYQKATAVAIAERKFRITQEEDIKRRDEMIRNFNQNELFWIASPLYELYCQRKISLKEMGEFYSSIAYQGFQEHQQNCSLPKEV
jgi:TPR repeat protein